MPDRETRAVHIESNLKIVHIKSYDGSAEPSHHTMLDQMPYNGRWSDIRIIPRYRAYIDYENAEGVTFLSQD
jgi:hypothetical protein